MSKKCIRKRYNWRNRLLPILNQSWRLRSSQRFDRKLNKKSPNRLRKTSQLKSRRILELKKTNLSKIWTSNWKLSKTLSNWKIKNYWGIRRLNWEKRWLLNSSLNWRTRLNQNLDQNSTKNWRLRLARNSRPRKRKSLNLLKKTLKNPWRNNWRKSKVSSSWKNKRNSNKKRFYWEKRLLQILSLSLKLRLNQSSGLNLIKNWLNKLAMTWALKSRRISKLKKTKLNKRWMRNWKPSNTWSN